ncbi:respiratory nitrate reductase subunit gamma [Litchfieldia salsa]|uniref:Nitrate reductase gamma subunit n=1 Tax=Litchfieldia salsa TaxID=930152 RepID=A0A1H0WW26_9BACI|nr:respiratory nitrate reductase subunit gamma [Litchfieldia salsa]SDP94800.1 Nitrate reductase gamma subunit [Litchfieldia salsa]
MDLLQGLLWVALPYSSIAILVMGFIWQYDSKEQYKEDLFSYFLCWKNISVFLLIGILIGTGVYSVFILHTQINAFEWLLSLVYLNPSLHLIEATPLIFKIHLVSLCTLFIFLPFTKYIKVINSLFKHRNLVALPVFFLLLNIYL